MAWSVTREMHEQTRVDILYPEVSPQGIRGGWRCRVTCCGVTEQYDDLDVDVDWEKAARGPVDSPETHAVRERAITRFMTDHPQIREAYFL